MLRAAEEEVKQEVCDEEEPFSYKPPSPPPVDKTKFIGLCDKLKQVASMEMEQAEEMFEHMVNDLRRELRSIHQP